MREAERDGQAEGEGREGERQGEVRTPSLLSLPSRMMDLGGGSHLPQLFCYSHVAPCTAHCCSARRATPAIFARTVERRSAPEKKAPEKPPTEKRVKVADSHLAIPRFESAFFNLLEWFSIFWSSIRLAASGETLEMLAGGY